jgi:hypothetical protein
MKIRMMSSRRVAGWLPRCAALAATLAIGCSDEAPVDGESGADNETPAGDTACEVGKCDGVWSNARDYFDDMRRVNLEDLASLGAGLATDELNGVLSGIPYAELQLGETELYGEPRQLFGETFVHDIADLHHGLTRHLGEKSFATRINGIRSAQVQARPGTVFAEAHFRIGAELSHNWSFDAGDGVGNVGFFGRPDLEAVIIAPFDSQLEGAVSGPLQVLKTARDYVLPRDMGDLRGMVPGESFALRARGGVGLNVGLGIPLYASPIGDFVTLTTRFSAGARVAMTGQLDVQFVRGEGDDAWIDVGITDQNVRHFEVAIRNGWGVAGLPEVDIDLGAATIDIDDIAERVLSRELNQRLETYSLEGSRGRDETRISVARFRIDLAQTDEETRQAVAQALRGDIRLAQALANRNAPGVFQELDLTRDKVEEASYLGFRFLGMAFYRGTVESSGRVTLDTDDGAQTLLFNEIERRGGLFFTDRQSTWRNVVSMKRTESGPVDAQVNARLTIRERDRFLTRDQILDHVDPLLAWLTGYREMWFRIGAHTDALAERIDHTCPTPPSPGDDDYFDERDEYEACVANLHATPAVRAIVDQAKAEFASVRADLKRGLDPTFTSEADIADALYDLKLGISGIHDRPDASLDGPEGRILTQLRFSNEALTDILQPHRAQEFRAAVEGVVRLMHSDRDRDIESKTEKIDDFISDKSRRLDRAMAAFEAAASLYTQYDAVAGATFGGERVGDHGRVVRIPVNRPRDLTVASVAEYKGGVVQNLFEQLVDGTDGLREPEPFISGYALLWMADPGTVELLSDFTFEEDDYAAYNTNFYGRGVAPFIDAGEFDLDELLGSD